MKDDGSIIEVRTRPGNPDSYNDRMTFESWDDFDDYYDYLSGLQNDSLDIDSLLAIEEGMLSYTSLRESWIQPGFTQAEMDSFHSTYFIGDFILESILNEYHELGIADSVFVYQRKGKTFRIVGPDSDVIDEFRATPKGGYTDPIDLYDQNVSLCAAPNTDWIGISDFEIVPRTFWDVVLRDQYNGGGACSNSRVRGFHVIAEITIDNVNFHRQAGNWTVNWGDGTATQTFTNVDEIQGSHLYLTSAGNGPFELVITFTWTDPTFGQTEVTGTDFNFNPAACRTGGWIESGNVESNNGTRSITFNLEWNYRGGNGRSIVTAVTRSWQWHGGDAKWIRKKSNIYAKVDAIGVNGSCGDPLHFIEERSYGYQNKVQADVYVYLSRNKWHDDEVTSKHSANFSTFQVDGDLSLNVCQ